MTLAPGQRLFLALFVQEILHAALLARAREWARNFGPGFRIVPGRRLHLTLAFLGDVPDEASTPLVSAVRDVCGTAPLLHLFVAGCGAFPNERQPRVVWAGVGGDLEALSELAQRLQSACQPFAPRMAGQQFHPHLTLARTVGSPPRRPLVMHRNAPVFGEWTADAVVLARSHLQGKGAVNIERERIPLTGKK